MGGNHGKSGQFALSTSASESGGLRGDAAGSSPTILVHIEQEYQLIVHRRIYKLHS